MSKNQENQTRFNFHIERLKKTDIKNYIYPNQVEFHHFSPVECNLCFHCSRAESYFLHAEPFASEMAKAVSEKRLAQKRLEIYKKYQNSAGVKTLNTILHHQESLDELTVGQAIEMMIQLSEQAMREAGCYFNVLGQQNFDDAVYFDFTMSKHGKIELLSLSDIGGITDKAKQMIKEIEECH